MASYPIEHENIKVNLKTYNILRKKYSCNQSAFLSLSI